LNLSKYKTIIFDCDGVVLNSNEIKTNAFYDSTIDWGIEYAEKLVHYHVSNGGVSRYMKFNYFLDHIINHLDNKPTLEFLLESYAEIVYKKLLICEITSKLKSVRAVANNSKWMIISGGKEEELRLLFNERNIGHYFNGGIFGSPTDKLSIFQREIKTKNIEFPALFLGDSEYDFVVSKEIGVDFIFVSDWSEFKDIKSYSSKHKIKSIGKVSDILKLNNE